MVIIVPLKYFALIGLIPLLFAYPYNDFIKESDYKTPVAPSDTILSSDCSNLPLNQDVCYVIKSQPLTQDERKTLLLEAINPNTASPDFQIVKNWNDKLVFTKYPLTPAVSSGSIRDAWVKIISLRPSVLYDKKIYLNSSGEVTSAFGFTFVVPDQPAAGDCKTQYYPEGYDYGLNISLNGKIINKNNEKQTLYNLTNNSNSFDVKLSIVSAYQILHFRDTRHCQKSKDGEKCWTTCDYFNTEEKIDHLQINNSKQGELYDYNLSVNSFVDDVYSGISDLWLNYNIPSTASIDFEGNNSYFRERNVDYELISENLPYNTLQFSAIKNNDKTPFHFTILDENRTDNETIIHAHIQYSDNCTIKFQTFFSNNESSNLCNTTNVTTAISANIENNTGNIVNLNLRFFENDTNNSLSGKNLTILYSGHFYSVITDQNGEAKITFPYIHGSQLVEIFFQTDMHIKSARTTVIISSSFFELNEESLYILGFIFALLFLFNLVRGGFRNVSL